MVVSPLVIMSSRILNLVTKNIYYPFQENRLCSAQFIVDSAHWALLYHLDSTGKRWVSYRESEGLTTDICMEHVPAKFERLIPEERPVAGKDELKSMSPYRSHQHCGYFRKGLVVLAGDAQHLCNPFWRYLRYQMRLTIRTRVDGWGCSILCVWQIHLTDTRWNDDRLSRNTLIYNYQRM